MHEIGRSANRSTPVDSALRKFACASVLAWLFFLCSAPAGAFDTTPSTSAENQTEKASAAPAAQREVADAPLPTTTPAKDIKLVMSRTLKALERSELLYSPVLAQSTTPSPVRAETVVIQLKWLVQFQFAGYYAALDQGFYHEAGLNVDIRPSSPDINVVLEVLEGRADYGIGEPSLIIDRENGLPLVVIAAIFQHSPGTLITLKSSGLKTPQDLAGRRVMVTEDMKPTTIPMFRHEGVPAELLNLIPHSWNVEDLVQGKVDAMTVYRTNELPLLQRRGIEVNVIAPMTYGIDFYGDCLFTTEQKVRGNPTQVERFLAATRKGWQYAFRYPDETIRNLREKHGARKSYNDLLLEMEETRKLVVPELVEIGNMNIGRWRHVAQIYNEAGLLSPDFPLEDFIYNPIRRHEQVWREYLTWAGAGAVVLAAVFGLLLLFNHRLKVAITRHSAELNQNQSRLALALEGANDGIWDWDSVSGLLYINPQWIKALGYTVADFPRSFTGWLGMLHPEDAPHMVEEQHRLLRGEVQGLRIEFRCRCRDGAYRWTQLRGKVHPDNPRRMVGTITDVTERHKKAEKLQSRLSALTSPDTNPAEMSFADIFDIEKIQALQDSFADAFQVASLITSADGEPLTRISRQSELCCRVASSGTDGQEWCKRAAARAVTRGKSDQEPMLCQRCGLFGGGAGIYAGDKHLANWLVGQVRDHDPTPEECALLAPGLGMSAQEYHSIFSMAPLMPKENFRKVCRTIELVASQLSELAFRNVVQARVISERTRAEQKLLESEALLKEAQSIAHVGHWSFHFGVGLFDCSDEARRILGLPYRGTLDRASLERVIHPDDRARHTQIWEHSLRTGEHLKSNVRALVNGITKHVYIRGVILAGKNNNPEYILGIIQDVTERVEKEQALREQEENLRITLDSIADGVIAADAAGSIIRMNPVAQELTGWNIMEGRSQLVCEVFRLQHPETHEAIPDPIAAVLRSGAQRAIPDDALLVSRGGGYRQVSGSVSPIRNEKGNLVGAALVFRDITAQQQLAEQLRQAQKMEAIGQLAGGIAHDFNNLLGGIMGFAELITLAPDSGEKVRHYAEQIGETAGRAAQLTSQLLTFARKGKLPSTPFDVHEAINAAVSLLRHSLDRKIEIVTEFRARRHNITGDPVQIQNAIINLGINARDALPEGGQFRIVTDNQQINSQYCAASSFELTPGEYLRLTVSDNGTGITHDNLPKIFEPFFTTKQVGKGTGLGLSAVFGTVTAHGGAITVASEVDKGTEFQILLPTLDEAAEWIGAAIPLPASAPARPGGGRMVLVIDDEAVIRAMAQHLLAEAGYQALVAAGGEEGVALYREHAQEVVVAIVDMVMPQMDGIDTLRQLKEINPHIKVLAASGFSQNERIDRMLKEGAADFIAKPYSFAEITKKIEALIARPD